MSTVAQDPAVRPVGVVIVNFNSGLYLNRCLKSLLSSTVALEVVIVDNDSADASVEAVAALDVGIHAVRTVRNTANLGFSKAVNIGRDLITQEYLLILNPDCIVHPHTIDKLRHALDVTPNSGLVGPLVFNEDGTEQRGCRRNEPTLRRSMVTALGLRRWRWGRDLESVDLAGSSLPAMPTAVDAVSGSCMMITTQLFDQIGGMDERYFLHCEDLDLCRRVRDAGQLVLFVPGVSIFHRQGGSGGAGFYRVEKLKHQGMVKYYEQHHTNHVAQGVPGALFAIRMLVWSHYLVALIVHWLNRIRENRRPARNPECLPLDLPHFDLVVTGARSDVGDALLAELTLQSRNVLAITRQCPRSESVETGNGTRWLSKDYFDLAPADDLPDLRYWIHLAPIWSTDAYSALVTRCGVRRVIALGSSSVVAKATVADRAEQQVVLALQRGEDRLISLAEQYSCSWAILRPTLIYGGRRNRNINSVKRIIRVTGHFFVVGDALGRRQPVHARDVALACLGLISSPHAEGRFYLPGGETVSYREMVERVFDSMGRRPRIVTLSDRFAQRWLSIISKIPGMATFSPELGNRMSIHQEFDARPAIDAFDYQPQPFNP